MNVHPKATPAWFNLDWERGGHSLIFKIHEDVISQLPILTVNTPFVEMLIKNGFPDKFSGNLSKGSFGFNDQIHHVTTFGNFKSFAIELPVIRKKTTTPCGYCHGKGTLGDPPERQCLYCNGEGKMFEYNWKASQQALSNVGLLLYLLDSVPEKETRSPFYQLLTIRVGFNPSQYYIGGTLSMPVLDVLQKESTHFEEVIRFAMARARKYMFEGRQTGHFLNARINEGGLLLECSGDARFVYAEGKSLGATYVKFHDQGIDNALYTFIALLGLAAMTGEIERRSLRKPGIKRQLIFR